MAIGAAAVGTLAYAYTETVETMTVELQDGQKVEYKIEDVAKVSFDAHEETIGFRITDANDAELYRSATAEPMFRMAPEDESAATTFLFGTVENAAELADLKEGKYMVRVDMTNAALFQPDLDIAVADAGVTVRLYEWTDGEISATHENVTEGTITTSRNARGIFTMELQAKFEDGVALRASYRALPTDVTDLEVLFPTPGPKNALNYYDRNGDLTVASAKIVGFKKEPYTKSSLLKGAYAYTAIMDDGFSTSSCTIVMQPDAVGQKFEFASMTEESNPLWSFEYKYNNDGFQVFANNPKSGMTAIEGTLEIIEHEDGTLTVNADVTNKYKNFGNTYGDNRRVTIEYEGACEGLEPAPKNNVEYYNQDGTLTRTVAIEGFKKTSSSFSGTVKYTATLGGDNAYTKCYLEMKPELVGQLINFADFTEVPEGGASQFMFYFDDVQLAGPNSQWKPQGTLGTMQVVENGDGTITVKADVFNKYINNGTEGGNNIRVVIDYKGECSGL